MPKITKKYFKRSRRGQPPVMYDAYANRKTKRLNEANIKIDPILKKYPKYRKSMLAHEHREIKLRSKGINIDKAHKISRSKEPLWLRKMSLSQMWRKLK